MKKLFNTTILFFILTLSLALSILTGTTALGTQSVDLSSCIKNINNENAVLVLNNRLNGEISSRNNRNNHILSNSTPLILAHQSINDILIENKAEINKYFINNLSTDKQKIHQIRAP